MSTQMSQRPNEASAACGTAGNVTGNACILNQSDHVCPYCGRCKHCGQPVPPVINPVYPQPIVIPSTNTPPWPGYPPPYVGDPPSYPWTVTCGTSGLTGADSSLAGVLGVTPEPQRNAQGVGFIW